MTALMFASVLSLKAQYGGGYGGGGYGRQRMSQAGQEQSQQQANRPIPTAKEMADMETKRETELLNLTPEQAVKVKAIHLNYGQQRLDLLKELQATKDHDAVENKLKGIKLAQDNELKEVLTPEQQVLLAKGKKMKGTGKKDHKKEPKPSDEN